MISYLNETIKVGDYVLCDELYRGVGSHVELIVFLSSNVGKVVYVSKNSTLPYKVKFVNIPENLLYRFDAGVRDFISREIVRFAKPEEIESTKY